jgi:uncharacterized membrane protein YhiD involved in acid resistance
MVKNIGIKIPLVFSGLALIISILTFFKTGGLSDIKEQINVLKKDIIEVRSQTEMRMENRSLLFDALCDLNDSVNSLKTDEIFEAKRLINEAIAKIVIVEKNVTIKKRKQLKKIRKKIEDIDRILNSDNPEIINQLEYQIMFLRIFEENL